ncbi:hypothetical protein BIV57_19205 [Mangrovactinospora gilvigrisea]|uniref:Helix-turn-helix domain-containing protein n=1 Tax=Mangrovactinospora gilvigrisea TaxID=1428644 RepID=A0A1J7BQX7_9ACTN|nr:helix-turn-helix domain-containing protein [Mangrovactinospora gilvigrisea]OIV35849.1 hypothetical protein BIV57_19205 [Mangrovactinospora gilvigrisea]
MAMTNSRLGRAAGPERSSVDGPIKLYTAEEAAKILQCSAKFLNELANARKIPFTFVGDSRKIRRWTDEHLREIALMGEYVPPVRR